MSKNIRVLYMYIVCLIGIGMIIGGFIVTINSFTSYAYPVVYYYGSYSNDKDYYDSDSSSNNFNVEEYKKEIDNQTRSKKRESLKDGITSLAVVIVGVCLYSYHWKKIESDRKLGEV